MDIRPQVNTRSQVDIRHHVDTQAPSGHLSPGEYLFIGLHQATVIFPGLRQTPGSRLSKELGIGVEDKVCKENLAEV